MEVHRIFGNGFQKIIYQRAFAIEFNKQNISISREHGMDILDKGEDLGTRRVNFIVEGKVVIGVPGFPPMRKNP
jgi:GxxExxY protein